MLSALLEFEGERHAVFVRNLSVSGALIDAPYLPLAGETVILHRDQQKIPATVAWTDGNRCGLTFTAHVKVDALIKRLKPAEATSAHQGRIDAIQHALRENRAIPSFAETEDLIGASAVGKKLADEIGFAHRLVESVSETLSNDAYILTRYVVVLQQLDEAEQLLRKLAGSLSAEGASGRC